MKSIIAKSLVTLAIISSAAVAEADVPAWLCNLNFQGQSKSVQIIVGKSEFKGAGTVRCVDGKGARVEYPVSVTMTSGPIAPRLGLGKFELYGEALQVAVSNKSPEALLGDYLVVEGRAGIVGGAGAMTAVHAGDDALSLTLSLQVVKGFGIEIGFRKMKIELDKTRP